MNPISKTPPPEARCFREGFYFTYPHSNAFCRDGHSLVLGQLNGPLASLWKTSLHSEENTRICEFDVSRNAEKLLWFDVAEKADRLVTVTDNSIWIYDLQKKGNGTCIYRAEEPAKLLSLASITADGRHVILSMRLPDRYAALLVEVESGKGRILFEYPWYLNHFQFSPYDETWIGFCHEGATETVSDRVWGWHAIYAPTGRCLLDQNWGNPARELNVGHERWSFHAPTVLAVAYGCSPGEPRGIYEISLDGKAPQLISQGNRHLHVGTSCSGRFVAIDTSGPHDLPGKGWENANNVSDVLLLNRETGEERWIARSRIEPHPSHPHPTFSPDDKYILFNEAIPGRGNRARLVKNPWLE